jgi:hypothetical protein
MVAPPVVAAPAAPRSSGSPVIKIVLIVLAVLMLLGLLAVGSCVYFVYRAKQRVTQFEKQVHANFPVAAGTQEPTAPGGGTAPVGDLAEFVYPGATPAEGGGEMTIGGGGVKVLAYTTADSVDQVATFYKNKVGSRGTVIQSGGSATAQIGGSNGLITITIAPDTSSGKTKITISSLTR